MKVLLLICMTINLAFAADENTSENLSNKVTYSSTSELSLPSAGNREKVKYQISFNLLGAEYSTSATSLSLGYYLRPNDMLLLRYSNYNGNYDSSNKLRAVTLGYRRFEGNSFNIMPSLYYRENTITYSEYVPYMQYQTKDFLARDIGIGFRIGNEWQWDHFMMGVDWIGVSRSIHKFSDKRSSNIIAYEHEDFSVTFLSLCFGYSF